MRNEKIFNAMEHLEDKYIAEAMEEYSSAKDMESEEKDPVDPYTEAVLFYAEDNVSFKKGRFLKWAGLAAGVCAVTAGVVIMGKSGLFEVVNIPFVTSSETTEVTVASSEITEASVKATEPEDNTVIVSIIDRTKTEGIGYDDAFEKFFEDEKYEYYFSGIYSQHIIVHYEDGSQEDIATALNAGRATIADLDRFEVSYYYKILGAEGVFLGPVSKTETGFPESFNAEIINTGYGVKQNLLNGLTVVQGNKIYYVVNDWIENEFSICSYDIEKHEIETVSTEYYDNAEKINYDFIGIYSDSLYYRLSLYDHSSTSTADEKEFYCIKKLNLSTGESENIYSYTREPSVYIDKAVIIDNYLLFEDIADYNTTPIYCNIVRYDMESGNTIIFKENASAPASHKDKLIFCRRQDGNLAIYSCDLKSGENEEKLCDLSSNYVYPSICSDGEKIWVSVLDTLNDTFTVGYLDENNNLNPVKSSIKDGFPYEFKYANGYIVLHDMMIDAKSEEITAIENVRAVGNELYYGEYQTKYNQRTKEYQKELILYHLSK